MAFHNSNEHLHSVLDIVHKLNHIPIDGEGMQFIIEKTGMKDQMLRQLIMTSDAEDILELLKEKVSLLINSK